MTWPRDEGGRPWCVRVPVGAEASARGSRVSVKRTDLSIWVQMRGVGDSVRMRLERSSLHEIEKEVLSCFPAKTRWALNGDAKSIVGESLDRGQGDLSAVADDEETEAHDNGSAVDEQTGPEKLPAR